MLGIGCLDRHALPRITSSKSYQPRCALPSRASGFVLRRNGVDWDRGRGAAIWCTPDHADAHATGQRMPLSGLAVAGTCDFAKSRIHPANIAPAAVLIAERR